MNARTEHSGTAEKLEQLPIAHILLSDTQTQERRRRRFTDLSLADLTESVRQNGIAQPVLVRALVGDGADALKRLGKETYQLVDGERRYRAAVAAGLSHLPAVITNIDHKEVVLFQITTNKHHESLHALDEAAALEEIMKVQSLSVEEAAERLGMKRAHAYNRLKLLQLAPEVLEALEAGTLPATHALHIARIPGPKLQKKALKFATTPSYHGLPSERELADHLRRSFMVRIDHAPFKASDEGLDPRFERATCLRCPHYSANDAELHAEVEAEHGIGATLCTDKPCHDNKVQGLFLRRIELARSMGLRIIDGDEAKAILPHQHMSPEGYIDLDDECGDIEEPDNAPKNWRAPTYRELLEGQQLPIALLLDPHNGQPREVIEGPVAAKLLKKAGVKVSRGLNSFQEPEPAESDDDRRSRHAEEAEARAKQQARENLERSYRAALLKAIHEKWKGELKREELVAVADILVERGEPAFVFDEFYAGHVNTAKMSERDLHRVIFELAIGICVEYVGDNPGALVAAAKRFRIDPVKVKKQVKAAQEKE